MMGRFLLKFVVYSAALYAVGLFPSLFTYGSIYQPIIAGAILAVAGLIIEELTLNRYDAWISTVMDFITSGTVLFLFVQDLKNVRVSLVGALTFAFLISIYEYFAHIQHIKHTAHKEGQD